MDDVEDALTDPAGTALRPPHRGGRSRAAALLAVAVWAAGAAAGCGRAEGARSPEGRAAVAEAPRSPDDASGVGSSERAYVIEGLPPERLRLIGAASSLDDLLRTVERALAERDSVRLFELMVTPEEYRDILFPAFPAAHPPINASFETVWVLHITDALPGLRKLLQEYGGKQVRILDVRFDKPGQDFVNFVLDETSHVDIEVEGRRLESVRLFGSVYHIGDQYKILSYPD